MLINYTNNLMMQIMIILVPGISAIFARFNIYESSTKKKYVLMLAGISSSMCVSYSNYATPEFMDDFRLIPLILIQLFIGITGSLVISVFILTTSFFLKIDNIFLEMIITFSSLLFMIIYSKINHLKEDVINENSTKLIHLFVYLFLIKNFLMIIINFELLQQQNLYSLVLIPFLQIITLHSLLYLIHTRKKQKQREYETLENEKQKMVSQMAAAIAHEVRNPITVVKGFVQLIQQGNDFLTKEKINNYLDLCSSELDRAEFIIKDYLSFSKPDENELANVEVNESIHKILSIVNSYSNLNNIQLEYNFEQTKNISIYAYKEKLEQILLNMIKNAIEACVNVHNAKVEIHTTHINENITIHIKDNGEGFPKELLQNIGIAYQTTKSTGTGLGLMVSKKLIEEMNGRLKISSEIGKGSLIQISLPITAQ